MIWLVFDAHTLEFRKFLWFGGVPGAPLPDMSRFRTAKHSKANAQGFKAERPNIRVVTKGKFHALSTISDVVDHLFALRNKSPGDTTEM